jgi:tRNA pseudouridine65 synthase
MEIEVVFEDESLIVVNKPNNLLVHASYYARNIKEPSMVDHLGAQVNAKLYPVHRLDYKTSGCIVLAKSSEIAAQLQKQFENQTIKKTYIALLRGYVNEEGLIETPVKNAETGKYKEAKTYYGKIESVEVDIAVQPYDKSRYSLVEFRPETGRMHQLRIHANKISHPIIGDHKYGNRHHNKMFAEELGVDLMFLHAYQLGVLHPNMNEFIHFQSYPSAAWNLALQKLGFVTRF